MAGSDILEVSVHIAAQPETDFPYFTDPARYVLWMGSEVDLEPVPGGTYRVRMRDGVETVGEFLEVDPPRRLVFTWGWTQGPPVPPAAPGWSLPSSLKQTAPVSSSVTTTCRTSSSASTTRAAGRCTSAASPSAWPVATRAATPTPDRPASTLWPASASYEMAGL